MASSCKMVSSKSLLTRATRSTLTSTSCSRLPTRIHSSNVNQKQLHTSTTSCNSNSDSKGKQSSSSSLLSASPLSPSIPPPSNKQYNPITVSLVKGVAKLMGYNSTTSTAIRVSSDLYDRCAERTDVERDFWYKGEFQKT